MKALLDSTQINDLNAAVDEMKKENDNRGPSKSGKWLERGGWAVW